MIPATMGAAFTIATVMSRGPQMDSSIFHGELIASNQPTGNQSSKSFTIQGSVVDLYPGASKTLTLQLGNPNSVDINVTSVTVTVASTSKVGCPATDVVPTNFSVKTGRDGVAVKSGKTATLTLPIRMVADSNASCSGAKFFLNYTGTAVQ